ncbi:hypothetical protein [Yeosuana sp.]|uniref:hypothetical protein n=1 Tax=Yeosuana sp. TaxID=2529388 RepID=UPI0040553392|tara:strand:- start:3813 stop:4070 length:258 start_codon:yes stop_codon:yes gene_type:complete
MKNLLFVLAFMLMGTFAFASSGEFEIVKESTAILKMEAKKIKTLETKFEYDWACCTVTRNGGSATVCRSDGNAAKACRQARQYTK